MQAISKEAFEAEDALQRQLAKKLGIKGKKRKVGAPAEKANTEEPDAIFAGMPSQAGVMLCTKTCRSPKCLLA